MYLANFGFPDDEALESAGCQGELACMQLDVFPFEFGNVRIERGQIDFFRELFKTIGIQIDAIDIVSHRDIVRSFQHIIF